MIARPDLDRRYALSNREFAVHPLGGGTEKLTLPGAAELRAALEDHFLINLTDLPELDAGLAEFCRLDK
jgi:N-hydroxyarylamine O-acetyltransferase